MKNDKKIIDPKKELLLKVVGSIIKEKRLSKNKGILLLSYEYDIANAQLHY